MSATTYESKREVINVDELLARCLGNTGIVERILSKFQDRFGIDLNEIEQGVAQCDGVAVAQAAHRIKGASANVSAPTIYEIASEIEQLGRADRLAEVPTHVEQLRVEWARFVTRVSTLSFS